MDSSGWNDEDSGSVNTCGVAHAEACSVLYFLLHNIFHPSLLQWNLGCINVQSQLQDDVRFTTDQLNDHWRIYTHFDEKQFARFVRSPIDFISTLWSGAALQSL